MVPILQVTMPGTLTGQANGRLDLTVKSPVYFPKWGYLSMEKHAARAWGAMALQCYAATGRHLTATSPADVYRTYEQQERVFLQRMTKVYNPLTCTTTTRMWNGKKWWLKRGYAPVATPGTSNHGWGLAVDVAVFVPESRGVVALYGDKPVWNWVRAHATAYGFSWEGRNEGEKGFEPWHLRYVAGSVLPGAVTQLEDALAKLGGGAP